MKASTGVHVATIQTDIQVLWELEQPPTTITTVPSFPLRKRNGSYEVGLLWKGEERPEDNKKAAVAAMKSLVKRLKDSGTFEQYENTLMRDYAELGGDRA